MSVCVYVAGKQAKKFVGLCKIANKMWATTFNWRRREREREKKTTPKRNKRKKREADKRFDIAR